MTELSDFVVGELPANIVQTPTFLAGELGRAVFKEYVERRASVYGSNPNLSLELKRGVVVGSSFFDVTLTNQILEQIKGARTALPVDLSNPRVLEMIREKHYSASQALVLRSVEDAQYSRNNRLAGALAEHIDAARLSKEPALMHGFDLKCLPEDKEGYGLIVVPNEDFTVHYDGRLLHKWNGYKFDSADEIGLPIGLNKTKGERTWFTREVGLSGLNLNRYLDLSSDWHNLALSDSDGRVVVVGEATKKIQISFK